MLRFRSISRGSGAGDRPGAKPPILLGVSSYEVKPAPSLLSGFVRPTLRKYAKDGAPTFVSGNDGKIGKGNNWLAFAVLTSRKGARYGAPPYSFPGHDV